MQNKKSQKDWARYFLEQALDALKSGEAGLAVGFAAQAIAALEGEGHTDAAQAREAEPQAR